MSKTALYAAVFIGSMLVLSVYVFSVQSPNSVSLLTVFPTKRPAVLNTSMSKLVRQPDNGIKEALMAKLRSTMPTLLEEQTDKGAIQATHAPRKKPLQTNESRSLAVQANVANTVPRVNASGSVKRTPVKVLINSYMRSGSTFLGSVIGWRQDAFYWFEPLWSTHQNVYINNNGSQCHYCKLQCDVIPNFEESVKENLTFLKDIYNCNFATHYERVQRMLRASADRNLVGPSWNVFRSCLDPNKRVCLQKLETVCRSKTHHVTKLLRADLETSGKLLHMMPDLKIIPLFRDPRGQLNSHIHTGWYPVSENNVKSMEDSVQVICERMRKDIATAKGLVREFPGRVKIVQYEDWPEIINKSKQLYRFLEMDYSANVEDMLLGLAEERGRDGFHPFSYRQSLSWTSVKIVNDRCRDIYKELGLTEYTNERDLRDLSISPVKKPLPYSLLV